MTLVCYQESMHERTGPAELRHFYLSPTVEPFSVESDLGSNSAPHLKSGTEEVTLLIYKMEIRTYLTVSLKEIICKVPVGVSGSS